jgi:hypothetical protein
MMIATGFFLLAAGLPQDAPREHVEVVDASGRTFRVAMAGVLDGANTLGPIGYAAPVQGFEPMRSLRLENAGETDLVNPWIVVNGRRRWRTARDIVQEALETYGSPQSDRERARAIWEYQRNHRFHASTCDGAENQDPVKMYNVYGYTLCGDEAPVLADLWRLAGLKTRAGHPAGHVLSEVWYEGGWHLLDSDEHVINLLRDNATIAGEEDLVRDHDLVKRTHTYGILERDSRQRDEFSASLFVHDGPRGDDHRPHLGHTMDFTLRPGEALEWRWSHVGKHHYRGTSLRAGWYDHAWARLRNGLWTYEPPLRRASARRGLHSSENVRWSEKPDERALSPEKPGEPAWAVWELRSPYVLVGGALAATGDEASFSISMDGTQWTNVCDVAGVTQASLDAFFPNDGPARYRYFLKARFKAGKAGSRTGLDSITIQNDVQMSAFALPSLVVGENVVAYTDETKGSRSARILFRWVERGGPPLPAAPSEAVSPPDGGEVEGTAVRFGWRPVPGPIVDYHFELGERADLRWTLSPNFEKLVSNCDGGDVKAASWALPQAGLLNPGRRYYWRVRAKDDRGAWGPWSRIWSFTPKAPGVPLHLRWGDPQGRDLTLLWDRSPEGRPPARYVVYGSNEKGFTASDQERSVWAGNQKSGGLFPGQESIRVPGNRLAETRETRLRFPPEHAFYRVAAIDDNGQRSGVSDVLPARRPFIYSEPLSRAKPGAPYRAEVRTIASIGDVRCRTVGADLYAAAFWDVEKPRFELLRGPAWLTMDRDTGVLSGTAPADFKSAVEVAVSADLPGVGTHQRTFSIQP